MFMREFVHLLWIIEGPKFMRAHAGNIFFYHPDGAFVPYRGAWYLVAKYLPTCATLCEWWTIFGTANVRWESVVV